MKISDSAIERLRAAADFPDLGGTRYRLVGKLGQGGMSVVYRLEDTVLDRQVAMKVANVPDGHSDLAARLLREAKIIAQLDHPGVGYGYHGRAVVTPGEGPGIWRHRSR